MTLSPDKTRAYIVDYDHVAVLCTLSLEVVNTVTVDARPSCVAVDSDGGRLYVADYAGDVTVFSVAVDDAAAVLAVRGDGSRSRRRVSLACVGQPLSARRGRVQSRGVTCRAPHYVVRGVSVCRHVARGKN